MIPTGTVTWVRNNSPCRAYGGRKNLRNAVPTPFPLGKTRFFPLSGGGFPHGVRVPAVPLPGGGIPHDVNVWCQNETVSKSKAKQLFPPKRLAQRGYKNQLLQPGYTPGAYTTLTTKVEKNQGSLQGLSFGLEITAPVAHTEAGKICGTPFRPRFPQEKHVSSPSRVGVSRMVCVCQLSPSRVGVSRMM